MLVLIFELDVCVLFVTIFQNLVWSDLCLMRKGLPFLTRVHFINMLFCVTGSMTPPLCHRQLQFSVPSGKPNSLGLTARYGRSAQVQLWHKWWVCRGYAVLCFQTASGSLAAVEARAAEYPSSLRICPSPHGCRLAFVCKAWLGHSLLWVGQVCREVLTSEQTILWLLKCVLFQNAFSLCIF